MKYTVPTRPSQLQALCLSMTNCLALHYSKYRNSRAQVALAARRTSSPALANLHLCQPSCNSSFEADQAPWAGPRLCELPEQRPVLPQRRTGPSGSGAGALHRLRRDWQASRAFGTHLRKQASLTSWGRKGPPCGDKEDAQKSYLGVPNGTP